MKILWCFGFLLLQSAFGRSIQTRRSPGSAAFKPIQLTKRQKKLRLSDFRGGSSSDESTDGENAAMLIVKEHNDGEEQVNTEGSTAETVPSATSTVVSELSSSEDEEGIDPDDTEYDERIRSVMEQATELRLQGKLLHDEGDWQGAVEVFGQASDLLKDLDHVGTAEDYCTCRLHEALCRLKQKDFNGCIQVCSGILGDDETDDQASASTATTTTSAAIRARAFHRRAKAHLALDDVEQALQDARSAAFLGDRKAVALYGKLMRESGGGSESSFAGLMGEGGAFGSDDASSPALLNELFQGKNPLSSSSSSNSALLESLLNKSPSTATAGANPFGDISSLLGGGGKKGGSGGLAKSLLKNLTKRIETNTDSICQYLHNTNPTQLQSMAAMAGVPLQESQAKQICKFAHKVTAKTLKRIIKITKRLVYVGGILRKALKVLNKYKQIVILWALFAWTRSAIRRPIPVNVKAAKKLAAAAAREAAAAAATTTTTTAATVST